MRSEDEPEIRNANLVRADREGHPSSDAQAVFRRRENQDCAGWPSGRTQHCGALPARRHRREPLLHLVEGVPGGRQTPPGGRYRAGSDQRRGQGSAPGSLRTEGTRRRAGDGIAPAQKKHDRGWGRRGMRYPACEKLEIIRLVEQSHLPVLRTLEKLGIPRQTFYRWYDRYLTGGLEALEDRSPPPGKVWNRIPDEVRAKVVDLALDEPDLSPRELAVRFTDTEKYFVSEASTYRILKAHDLITSPAFIV